MCVCCTVWDDGYVQICIYFNTYCIYYMCPCIVIIIIIITYIVLYMSCAVLVAISIYVCIV